MIRLFFLLAVLSLAAGCRDPEFIIIQRLAPGGGEPADGGNFVNNRPVLDIAVRMEGDSTGFRPPDLMRMFVNGTDRVDEVFIGGFYAILRIDPSPVGQAQFVELMRRTGDRIYDVGTWDSLAYTGPTISGVAPDTAQLLSQVTISGTGFSAGTVRVFFGGVEATTISVDNDTTITATVPADAGPGLVYVLVGSNAAEGIVGFQPLDASDAPIPFADGPRFFGAFPGNGIIETVIEFYGINFINTAAPRFGMNDFWTRVLNVQTVEVDPIGEIVMAFMVVGLQAEPALDDLRLIQDNTESNPLPFEVRASE